MRHMEVFEHLLGNATKDWGGNLSALVGPNGRVQDHRDNDVRIVEGSKSSKRGHIFCFRIRSGRGIDLLPRAGLSSRGIALQNRLAASPLEYDLLHHGAHFGGGEGRDHATRIARMKCHGLDATLGSYGSRDNPWRHIDSVIRHG